MPRSLSLSRQRDGGARVGLNEPTGDVSGWLVIALVLVAFLTPLAIFAAGVFVGAWVS